MSTTTTQQVGTEFEQNFIKRLEKLREDNGAMAALRRGLGKPAGTVAEMHPYVLPWVSGFKNSWDENPFYVVAALFAFWHQGKEGVFREAPWNLGASLGRLQDDSDSTEKRFVALLNSHEDDLPQRLRHAVGLLRSKKPVIPINWTQLLSDLRRWGWESRVVQRNWARGFWKADAAGLDEHSNAGDASAVGNETT